MTRRSVASRLLRLAALVIVAAVVVPFLPAQEGPQGETAPVAVFAPLAPPVPAPRNELDLLLNAPESTTPPGSDLEVIRYGHGGSVLRPAALDLPGEITAITLHRWDWLHLEGRDLEIALRNPYRRWLRMHAGTQGVIVSADRIELFGGALDWLDEEVSADSRTVSSGPVVVGGRGTARIIRDPRELTVVVGTGRFEVEHEGRLVAVLGPGQHGAFATVRDASDPDLDQTLSELRSALDGALERLLSEGTVTGDDVATLWEGVVRIGPAYFAAERGRDPTVPPPDAIRREVGEALRLLGAYRFEPPPQSGM
jgi:hypothetical protein